MNLLTITNEVLKIKNVSIKCVRILDIVPMSDTKETDSVEYSYVDCAAAIENILIEGVHLGLGTCWCAVGPKQERIDNFRQYYHLEDTLLPVGVIAVGYPAETKEKVDRYDPQKVTYFD